MLASNSNAKGKEIHILDSRPRTHYSAATDIQKIVALAKSNLSKEDVQYLRENNVCALVMSASHSKKYISSFTASGTNLILDASPVTYDDLLLAIEDGDSEQFRILYQNKIRTYSHAMEEALFLECDRLGWYDCAKMVLKTIPWNDKYITATNMKHYSEFITRPMVIPTKSMPNSVYETPECPNCESSYQDSEFPSETPDSPETTSYDSSKDRVLSTILDLARKRIAQKRAASTVTSTVTSFTPNETVLS